MYLLIIYMCYYIYVIRIPIRLRKEKNMKKLYYLQYLQEQTQYKTGTRKMYECTKKNKKGETILIEQFPNGNVTTYVTDEEGNCYGKYDPTCYLLITDFYSGYQVDREFLAKHSKDEILNEILRLFFRGSYKGKKVINTSKPKGRRYTKTNTK